MGGAFSGGAFDSAFDTVSDIPSSIERPILFRPAGALGLIDRDAVVQLRFNETEQDVRPVDAAGALAELDPANSGTGALAMPILTTGVLGRARLFDGRTMGLAAVDAVPGASLLTRDLSIQVVFQWDILGQVSAGTPGGLVSRGLGTGVAEYLAYGIELAVIDAPSYTGQARWLWQDLAGVLKVQDGGAFTCRPGDYVMLTATRRWVSPTEVRIRYYLGEARLAEIISTDGSIGGGTTGTFQLGTRMVGGLDSNFFAGAIDELLIVGRELCAEEVESTWNRITVYQPRGETLYLQSHDKGYPLPKDPGSDARLEVRMVGHALGLASSHTEDLRANFLPQRAYGANLENWEALTQPLRGGNLSIEERRARVLARMRQRRGCSIPGLKDLLPSLLGGGTVDDLEFLAFSNTRIDNFDTLDTLRWDLAPSSAFTPGANQVTITTAAVASPAPFSWKTMRIAIDANGKQAHQRCRLTFPTFPVGAEAGLYFGDAGHNHYVLCGLRNVAGSLHLWTESFVAGVSVLSVDQGDTGLAVGVPAPTAWLHAYQTTTDGVWAVQWSSTSATAGYSVPVTITHAHGAQWAGIYLRTVSTPGSGITVRAAEYLLRETFGDRPTFAYVLLDEALGFTPDVIGARQCVETIAHAYVHGTFVTRPAVVYGDPDNGYNTGPFGGY